MSTAAEIDHAARTIAWGILNPEALDGEPASMPLLAIDDAQQSEVLQKATEYVHASVASLRGPA